MYIYVYGDWGARVYVFYVWHNFNKMLFLIRILQPLTRCKNSPYTINIFVRIRMYVFLLCHFLSEVYITQALRFIVNQRKPYLVLPYIRYIVHMYVRSESSTNDFMGIVRIN